MVIKVVAFTVDGKKLRVFLHKGLLPQGELQDDESLDAGALRIFKNVLPILLKESYLEQLYTFSSSPSRSPSGHLEGVEIVYYILLPGFALDNTVILNSFQDLNEIPKQVRNDNDTKIISYAVQRLQWKIEYTNVVYSLLPGEFTLSELQQTYEAILGKELDKRNFRKKILSLKLLKDTGKKRTGTVARPASVYEFRKRSPVRVEVF